MEIGRSDAAWLVLRRVLVVMACGALALVLLARARGPAEVGVGARWVASSHVRKSRRTGVLPRRGFFFSPPPYFFHTLDDEEPWLSIDLGKARTVTAVELRNRLDCCRDRALEVSVELGKGRALDDFRGEVLGAGTLQDVDSRRPPHGRTVRPDRRDSSPILASLGRPGLRAMTSGSTLGKSLPAPAPGSAARAIVARLQDEWLTRRARRTIRALERPPIVRDLAPRLFFVGTVGVYFWIGTELERRGGFRKLNTLFNADCPRVARDMLRSHLAVPSKNVTVAHPFFVLLTNPLAVVLETRFPDASLAPARMLCHAAAALAVALAYRVFRILGAPRWLAGAGAAVYAFSASGLVLGSIVETFSFAALALVAGVLTALRSASPLGNAVVQVTAFGVNASLLPHTLFCAPLLWLPGHTRRQWTKKTLLFLTSAIVLTLALVKLQELLYPGAGFFFQKTVTHEYRHYWSVPRAWGAVVERWRWLIPHFFAFAIVAPEPLFTRPPDNFISFMLVKKNLISHYDAYGTVLASVWCALCLVATASNARELVRGDATARARIVLFAGWLLGMFLLFTIFGDDLFLYSPLWTFHLVAWVVLAWSPWWAPPAAAPPAPSHSPSCAP